MLKYLLLIALAAVIWWHWRKHSRPVAVASRPPGPAERMVTCAHCGVHLPLSEGLAVAERFYCCEAHRQAEEEKPSP